MRPRVLTIGTFDLLHEGHTVLFAWCRWMGNLTIGINSDYFVESYKGAAPFDNQFTRIRKCHAHAQRVSLHAPEIESTQDYIEHHDPDLLIVGSDWHENGYLKQLDVPQAWFDANQVAVLYAPIPHKFSSRAIRASQ